jgi:hypothetical protein
MRGYDDTKGARDFLYLALVPERKDYFGEFRVFALLIPDSPSLIEVSKYVKQCCDLRFLDLGRKLEGGLKI